MMRCFDAAIRLLSRSGTRPRLKWCSGALLLQRTSMAWIQHLTNEATRDSSQLYRQRERGISHV